MRMQVAIIGSDPSGLLLELVVISIAASTALAEHHVGLP